MASLKSQVEDIIRTLQSRYDCTAKRTANGHWMVRRPGFRPMTLSSRPGDPRAFLNIKSDIRKHLGVVL